MRKLNKVIPCAVFGHNYIKIKTYVDYTSKLCCQNCGTIIKTDQKGNFKETVLPSKDVQRLIYKLYSIKRRLNSLNAN
ncbi:hypothetical protein [Winogradskyella sp. PE311]|uniref:hypothetical protein n=1 Tax=Winogradskyella sp. PE311 TaxID=3366943 RepID=UPI003980E21E